MGDVVAVIPRALTGAAEDGGSLPIDLILDRRRPVVDQIYAALRAAIVSVRLPPGASISENRICRHFGVSRTPVHAALVRLVEDELIEVYPQRGSFVSPIVLNAVRDSHFVRRALETAVLQAVAKVWTPAFSARSRAMIEIQKRLSAAGDVERFAVEDEAFHQFFTVAAGLPGVWSAVLTAKAQVDRVHRLAVYQGRLPLVPGEHEAVIDALDEGRAEAAVGYLADHLDRIVPVLTALSKHHPGYFVDREIPSP